MNREILAQAYPLAKRSAQVRARAAIRRGAIRWAEYADIEQEAVLAVLRALPRFDSGRGSLRTFVERVTTNRIASLVRSAGREHTYLGTEFTEIAIAHPAPNTLQLDVAHVLKTLSSEERELCRLLAQYSITEVSRRRGVSRASLYRGIAHLRAIFTGAGLHRWRERGGRS